MKLLSRAVLVGIMPVLVGLSLGASRAAAQPAKPQECPHYWGTDHGGPLPFPDTIPVAGLTTNVPEYNDCQRFLRNTPAVAGRLEYLPIQAVWVRYRIRAWMANQHLLSNEVTPFRALLTGVSHRTEITTVGIVWSRGAYADLGIREGFNCIVMKYDRRGTQVLSSSYQSWMVPVASAGDCNRDPLKLDAAVATPLLVTSTPPMVQGGRADVVPQVARWDWDARKGVQYVSLWCPTGWCDYHRFPLVPSASYAVPQSMAATPSVIRQKGWYDEQVLMSPPPEGAATAAPVPSAARGTVFPVPGLAARTLANYRAHWRRVAWVSMTPGDDAYKTKYMYERDDAPPNGSSDNIVSMCFERAKDRVNADAGSRSAARLVCGRTMPPGCTLDTANDGRWYARIESASGAGRKEYCVMYRSAPTGVVSSGTVRWRWSLKDETIWVACPMGCCEADGIGP